MTQVKCVVWDLDGTVWNDVAVELAEGERPTPRADVLDAMRRLAEAGVLNSVASRSAPQVADLVADMDELSGYLVAPQVGWQDKSRSLGLIAERLGIAVDSLLLVDDSQFERAEVAHALPEVQTLDRSELLARLAEFLPSSVTPEAAGRTAHYQAEQRRRSDAATYPDREAFLASCQMRLDVRPATDDDRARVLELAQRAHRLSSTGLQLDDATYDRYLTDPDRAITVGRLVDRFGDYGLIGLAATRRRTSGLVVGLFAVSCRVAGRGVAETFLATIMAGAGHVEFPIRATGANVELRLLVRRLGFSLAESDGDVLTASWAGDAPAAPPWIDVISGRDGVPAVDALLADALGMAASEVAALAPDTPLFGPPLELGSLTGAVLLEKIKDVYGIDIAAEDLALEALTSLGRLRDYVRRGTQS